MCEFCHKHGEGKKWYLQAENYSADLLSDLSKRRSFDMSAFGEDIRKLGDLKKAPPSIKDAEYPLVLERLKNTHYGQVLPIEDVEQIFGFVNSVVRIECVCRKPKYRTEQRYCYGITVLPQYEELRKLLNESGTGFAEGPDTSDLEAFTKEEVLDQFREYEKEGLCHTVWTRLTPFIVGLCNCDRTDCGAMQATVVNETPIMFRAEYIAEIDPELCNGCRQCMRVCQFGAVTYTAASKKVTVDLTRCYGCGICRAVCSKAAIKLNDRSAIPAVAALW